MTLEELGLDVDDWLHYLRGSASEEVNQIIDEHFNEIDIPTKHNDDRS